MLQVSYILVILENIKCSFLILIFRIRKSLYARLELLEQGSLSTLIKDITLKEALYPLLTDAHLNAINRRLSIVLRVVELCTELNGWDDVLVP